MAARRLLIVMLVLLGISTLAAALVPQRTPREGTTSGTTTQAATTTAPGPDTVPPAAQINVGRNAAGKRLFPLVRARVGDQFTLLVLSHPAREIAIPEFGLVGFASPDTPARFELLPSAPGTFGVLFAASGKVAAQIEVVKPSAKKKRKGKSAKSNEKSATSRARGGSRQA